MILQSWFYIILNWDRRECGLSLLKKEWKKKKGRKNINGNYTRHVKSPFRR